MCVCVLFSSLLSLSFCNPSYRNDTWIRPDATITVSLIQVRTQDLAAQFVHDAHVAIWNHHHLQQQQEQQKHGHHHQHGNDHHQNHHQNKHHQHPVDDEGSWVVHLPQHDGRNPHGDSVRPGTFGKYTLTFLDSMIRLISFDGGEETTMGLETAHTNTSVFDALMFEFSHDLLVDYQVSGEALSSGCNLMSSAKTYQGEMVFGEMTYHNGFVVIMSPSSPSPSDEENGTDNGKRKTITIHYSLATGGRK